MKDINEIISRLIGSTRTRKRDFDLLEVCSDIEALVSHEGSIKSAAQTLTLSTSMLNQFLSINKLPDSLKTLLKNRTIDGVSAAYNLTKFSSSDQEVLASMLLDGRINSLDIRYISPLRKQYPGRTIAQLVDRLKSSADKKIYLIRINSDEYDLDTDIVKIKFRDAVGKENLIDVHRTSDELIIKLSKKGETMLRERVRQKNSTLKNQVKDIILN